MPQATDAISTEISRKAPSTGGLPCRTSRPMNHPACAEGEFGRSRASIAPRSALDDAEGSAEAARCCVTIFRLGRSGRVLDRGRKLVRDADECPTPDIHRAYQEGFLAVFGRRPVNVRCPTSTAPYNKDKATQPSARRSAPRTRRQSRPARATRSLVRDRRPVRRRADCARARVATAGRGPSCLRPVQNRG